MQKKKPPAKSRAAAPESSTKVAALEERENVLDELTARTHGVADTVDGLQKRLAAAEGGYAQLRNALDGIEARLAKLESPLHEASVVHPEAQSPEPKS